MVVSGIAGDRAFWVGDGREVLVALGPNQTDQSIRTLAGPEEGNFVEVFGTVKRMPGDAAGRWGIVADSRRALTAHDVRCRTRVAYSGIVAVIFSCATSSSRVLGVAALLVVSMLLAIGASLTDAQDERPVSLGPTTWALDIVGSIAAPILLLGAAIGVISRSCWRSRRARRYAPTA